MSLEQYVMTLNIEAETVASMAKTMLLPAAARYKTLLLSAELGELASEIDALISSLVSTTKELESVNLEENQPQGDMQKAAEYTQDTVIPAMGAVRDVADTLEGIVADDLWPLPKYSEYPFRQVPRRDVIAGRPFWGRSPGGSL